MESQPTGSFRPHHFQAVMSQVIQKDEGSPFLPPESDYSVDWSQRIYHACQNSKNSLAEQAVPESVPVTTKAWTEIWCLWEAARYCILARLRTPFGTPVQLFEAIERAVQKIAKLLKPTNQEAQQGYS